MTEQEQEQIKKQEQIMENTSIQKPIPELIPRLLPLEYCNIERAARMLNIEVDDIRHFNEVKTIQLYYRRKELQEGDLWDEDSNDDISYNFYIYKFIPFFVNDKNSLNNDDIYIKYAGLKAIHLAIYGGKQLVKLPQEEELTKIRKPRTEASQSTFIAALLELLPDLKSKLDEKEWKAREIVDDYFESKGLPPVRLGDNNYQNWMKLHKYKK